MKKIFIILLCVALLLLGGCKKTAQESLELGKSTVKIVHPTNVPEKSTEPEPPVPETVSGIALANHTDVVLMTLDRGVMVDVVGEFDEDYYVIATEQGFGLVEKRLIRLESEQAYEGWIGYAVSGAKVYDNYHLLPKEEQQSLGMNTEISVLDDLGICFVVQIEDTIGYMSVNSVSRTYIKFTPSGGGSSGGGSSGGADGGDISLSAQSGVQYLSTFIEQAGEVTGKGMILADDTEVLLGWFDQADELAIVNEEGFVEPKEGWVAVYLGKMYGYVRQNLVKTADQEAYAEWGGYARSEAPFYDNYYLNGDPVNKLKTNTEVQILWDLGNCYQVRVNETVGYMAKDQVSESQIIYSSGGGGGSGGSGGSGGDWTPPAM